MKTRLPISLLWMGSLVSLCAAASYHPIERIWFSFERRIEQGESIDLVRGDLYYQSSGEVVVHVSDPIEQWMRQDSVMLLVYYPESKQAMRFEGPPPSFPVPALQSILTASQEDLGLSEAGCTLSRVDVVGDTLVGYWDSPVQGKKTTGKIEVRMVDDRPVLVQASDPDGKVVARTSFFDWNELHGIPIPALVRIEYAKESGAVVDAVQCWDIHVNEDPPDSIAAFEMPPDQPIREYR